MLNHGDEVGEYTWTQASCDVDFFCMHTWSESDVHRFYTSFSRQRPFFILAEKRFCNFGLPHLWILILRVTWVDSLTFLSAPFPSHLSLIPQLLLVGWFSPARPWIWCHFNIGLILVVQIKSSEQFVSVWHQCFSGFKPTGCFILTMKLSSVQSSKEKCIWYKWLREITANMFRTGWMQSKQIVQIRFFTNTGWKYTCMFMYKQ